MKRFWGKIFGLKKDYLIAECELNKNEITRRKEEKQEGLAKDEDQKQKDEEEQLQKEQANEDKNRESTERVSEIDEKEIPTKEIPIPLREQFKRPKTQEPLEKPEVEIEAEPYGEGVNKKVYFVCNDFGEDWIEMPNATPMQIQVSRKIKRYFTGDLESEVNVYPKFPGKEKNYLRAQIARISSSTHISPLGFYTFGEKGEEEEDEEKDEDEEEEDGKNSFIENSQFTPIPMKDLTDTTLSFWVHHSNHLLKQGRATFWRQKKIKSGEEQEEAEEEEEQEDEEENIEEEVAETVIPLLSPLSEDKSLETTAIWSTRQTSIYAKENAVAFVCSNLWPGAYAFASGRSYGNIYMGWGHKYLAYGFSPTPLPFPEDEYEIGPEVMEIADPTPEMEKEWEESQKKKELENMASEEETEGGEDEEEDEEEDED